MDAMLQAFRQRRFRLFRILVLAAFMCGLAGQSLLDVMGDMHAMARHADGLHGHDLHADEHQHADHNGHAGAEGDAVHALFHHVYSCGHAAWMSSDETVTARLTRFTSSPAVASASGRISCDWTNPFRPPRAA
jgi:hypothetical protein